VKQGEVYVPQEAGDRFPVPTLGVWDRGTTGFHPVPQVIPGSGEPPGTTGNHLDKVDDGVAATPGGARPKKAKSVAIPPPQLGTRWEPAVDRVPPESLVPAKQVVPGLGNQLENAKTMEEGLLNPWHYSPAELRLALLLPPGDPRHEGLEKVVATLRFHNYLVEKRALKVGMPSRLAWARTFGLGDLDILRRCLGVYDGPVKTVLRARYRELTGESFNPRAAREVSA
jgi:hypothetical protein